MPPGTRSEHDQIVRLGTAALEVAEAGRQQTAATRDLGRVVERHMLAVDNMARAHDQREYAWLDTLKRLGAESNERQKQWIAAQLELARTLGAMDRSVHNVESGTYNTKQIAQAAAERSSKPPPEASKWAWFWWGLGDFLKKFTRLTVFDKVLLLLMAAIACFFLGHWHGLSRRGLPVLDSTVETKGAKP